MTAPEERAEALRALAALLRAGISPLTALREWHVEAPSSLRPALQRLSRRLSLGGAPEQAIAVLQDAFGCDTYALAGAISIGIDLGGNLPRLLERIASAIDRRTASERAGRAAAAGALLSARVVAGLPLLMLVMAAFARVPLWDGAGAAMLVVGGGLAVAGLIWIGRLVPRPSNGDDPGAVFADIVSSALAGGAPLEVAIEAAARAVGPDLGGSLTRASRLVALGMEWPAALARSDADVLREIAGIIRLGHRFGTPLAQTLETYAERRRTECMNRFEAELRRAPVLMVLPLSFCVLPAYAVLGLGPYLRSLSL